MSVFEVLTGNVLMEEVLMTEQPLKFEGVAFVDIHAVPKLPVA